VLYICFIYNIDIERITNHLTNLINNSVFHCGQVSVYADPLNKVLKGTKTDSWLKDSTTFLDDKIFIGNGISNLSRDELFKTGEEKITDNARFDSILLFVYVSLIH
jgi:hypothetical protein